MADTTYKTYYRDLTQFAFFSEKPHGGGDDNDQIEVSIYTMAYGADVMIVEGGISVLFATVTTFSAPRKLLKKMLEHGEYLCWMSFEI